MTERVLKSTKPGPNATCAEGHRFTLCTLNRDEVVMVACNLGFSPNQIQLALDEGGNLHDERTDLTLHFGEAGSETITLGSPLIVTKWQGTGTAVCAYGHRCEIVNGKFPIHGTGICAESGQTVLESQWEA